MDLGHPGYLPIFILFMTSRSVILVHLEFIPLQDLEGYFIGQGRCQITTKCEMGNSVDEMGERTPAKEPIYEPRATHPSQMLRIDVQIRHKTDIYEIVR